MGQIMEDQREYAAVPHIGDRASSFIAQSTHGEINFPHDFHDKWVILLSHPTDFISVDTPESVELEAHQKQFEKLNCQFLGLSDGIFYNHAPRRYMIKDKLKFAGLKNRSLNIKFPLIEDVSMKIAKKFGVIHSNGNLKQAIRSVFFIDPGVRIRAIIYYPITKVRNFEELRNVLLGLQRTDA